MVAKKHQEDMGIIVKMGRQFRNYLYRRKVKRSIRKANELKDLTGYRYYVIRFRGKVRVVPKRIIKIWMEKKYFKKGTTIQMIEKKAIYKTS